MIPCAGKLATPQLTVRCAGSRAKAVLTSARSRSASDQALPLVGLGRQHRELLAAEAGDHVARSAPPRRSASASRTSARSPALWPKRSLNSLNQSRSSNRIESARPVLAARSSSDENLSSNTRRLARPVSESVRATASSWPTSRAT